MANFFNTDLIKLEEEHSKGKDYLVQNKGFSLKLVKKYPNPARILDYGWLVTLPSGESFEAPMGDQLLTQHQTRLEWIVGKLKEIQKYEDGDSYAEAINTTIQVIYEKY